MNRYTITLLFACITICATAQIRVPKMFSLVKSVNPTSRGDYYTDGQYILAEQTPFQTDHPNTDEAIMNLLTKEYGISFNKLHKDFYYGTGKSNGLWKYVVVAKGLSFILTSKANNKGFQQYSKWLFVRINTAVSGGDQLYLKQ